MNRTFTVGLGICVLLGLSDLALVAVINADDAPPAAVVIIGAVLGVITLAAAVPAWRGKRAGVVTVVASRVASALLAVPVFFVDAPSWARIGVGIVLAMTVAGLAMLASGVRGRALAGVAR